ncbi:hypothetical protein G8759_14370 [Spirosoma aureum]|uniref:Uncharacterized protein n=1 Tax=Spirosoma aureum TaxID=2692134 RepID=A0A6G9AMZ7_9BACT|nr:hypothetical protein [Spirosoma aureum]QIP13716.1 hypothetical protein G8759_14370 [Spirosoma aureum]
MRTDYSLDYVIAPADLYQVERVLILYRFDTSSLQQVALHGHQSQISDLATYSFNKYPRLRLDWIAWYIQGK